MQSIEEYVPTEAETPADHWSKSPEYLAEKTLTELNSRVRGGMLMKPVSGDEINPKTGRRYTTHELTQRSFQTEYVPTEAETLAQVAKIKREYAETNEEIFEQLAKDLLEKVEAAVAQAG